VKGWATGRRAPAARARAAIPQGVRRHSIQLVDAGGYLLIPPYSTLLNASALFLPGALLLWPWSPGLLLVVGSVIAYQGLEVWVALRLVRADAQFTASLSFAPISLLWKAENDLLAVIAYRGNAWIRTERTPHQGEATADAECSESPPRPRSGS